MTDREVDIEEEELEDEAFDEDEEEDEEEGVLQVSMASTPVDFARLGVTKMAYIRQTTVNDAQVWGIFSAAGDPLGAAPSFEQAWVAVKQHHLQPVHVH